MWSIDTTAVIFAVCTVAFLTLVGRGVWLWFRKNPDPEVEPKSYWIPATEELVSRIIAKLPTYELFWDYEWGDPKVSHWYFEVPVATQISGEPENIRLRLGSGRFASVEFTPEQTSRVQAAAQAELLNRIGRFE